MPFIKHTEVGKRFLPRVSMSQDGLISFSDAATRKFALDQHKFIVLYYDPDIRRVGIELIDDEQAAGAIKLRLRETGAYAGGKSFVGRFEITLRATTTYDLTKDEESGFLVFDLDKGLERRGGSNDQENAEED